tara:strand:- start:166 stop:411 length:246 start_codon:yes stop_codon:yes gene_type:complete
MPKYTKENKAELIYKPFQKLKTKKAKVKFLEALLQERIDHPEHFRGLKMTQKTLKNLIKTWENYKKPKEGDKESPTLSDMK